MGEGREGGRRRRGKAWIRITMAFMVIVYLAIGLYLQSTIFLCRVRSTEGACKDVSTALIDICADIRVKSGK